MNGGGQKKQNFKMLSALFVSNLLVALSFSSCPTVVPPAEGLIDHANHRKMELPLILYLPPEKKKELPITLFDQNKRAIVSKAYWHPDQRAEYSQEKTIRRELVEIPEKDMEKIIHHKDNPLLAYPYSARWEAFTATGDDHYEIRL
jgi:hypothetical protein